MDMIVGIINQLAASDFFAGQLAPLCLLVTLIGLCLANNWRVWLPLLAVQAFVSIGLLTPVLDARLVFVKMVGAAFVLLILLITARQLEDGQSVGGQLIGVHSADQSPPLRLLGGVALLAVIGWFAVPSSTGWLPFVAGGLNRPIILLCLIGLLLVAVRTHPLHVGAALLTFLMGFELFYNNLEQSLLIVAALIATQMLIALVVSYVALGKAATPAPA